MNLLSRCENIIERTLTAIIVVLFVLMFGITNGNVIMRYIFNRPIIISVELARYCFVAIIYIGAIITTRRDKHIALDFFVNYMPHRIRIMMEQVGRLAMAGFFSVFLYYAIRTVSANVNVVSSAMQISMAIVYMPLVIGAIGIIAESLINVYLYGTGKKVRLSEAEDIEESKKEAKNGGEA